MKSGTSCPIRPRRKKPAGNATPGPVAQEGVQRREQIAEFCNTCHGPKRAEAFQSAPMVDQAQMQPQGHGQLDCLKCHEKAAGYGHADQEHTKCAHLSCPPA